MTDLKTQRDYLKRIERRAQFLKDRISGNCKQSISKVDYERKLAYEKHELESMLWAASELRKVIATNELFFKRLTERVAHLIPQETSTPSHHTECGWKSCEGEEACFERFK